MLRLFNRPQPTEAEDAETVDEAINLINQGELRSALRMLTRVANRAPRNYQYRTETEESTCCRFWTMGDFLYHSECWTGPGMLVWNPNAYGRACYYAAFALVEQKKFRAALKWIDRGLKLEPDTPELGAEKAGILRQLGRLDEAEALHRRTLSRGEECTPHQRGVAIRALGFSHIERGDLDEAERLYRKSLELEPDSDVALH